jgi:NTE family protein
VKKISFSIILLLIFSLKGLNVNCQVKDARPKVGLALSGGGAFGMAHIGVLKVMEEAGLRPDYITGVSMGSIVGSMYSIGYSADSLYRIFRDADWNLLLSNSITEDKVIFTEKKYINNSILSFPVTSRKVKLPSGLISGQHIEKMLSYYAWPAAGINDFLKLPIPFLCIGTDLVSCRKAVLKNGYLPDAVRASMAVPSAFTPIKIDTMILIDGGFVRNIAVSELKEMGADIVIGSYTGFNRYDENELQSITGVLKQLSFFNSINDFAYEKKFINYLIEPKESGLSIAAFSQVDTIYRRGYLAAAPFREKFRRLADSLDAIGPQKNAEFLDNRDSYIFSEIEITGNNIITDDQILGMLEISPGKPVSRDLLNDRIDLLYGRLWFDKVKYKIIPSGDSLKLVIECAERPQTFLYGAVHYDNFLKEGAIINLSAKNLLTGSSAIELGSYIGQFYRFRVNFTQFLGKNQKAGLSFYFHTDNTLLPHFEYRSDIGKFNSRSYTTGISFNKRTGLNHLMTISAEYKNFNILPDFISEDKLKRIAYNYFCSKYETEVNTLDSKYFPKKGFVSAVSVDYSKLLSGKIKRELSKIIFTEREPGDFLFKRTFAGSISLRKYFQTGRKVTMSFGGDLLYTYSADSVTSPQSYYFLGGIEQSSPRSVMLAGFHNNEIPVDRMAGIKFETDFEIRKDLHISLITNFAIAREPLNGNDPALLGGYGLGIGYMSLIGPLKIGLMQGFTDHDRYFSSFKGYINIGFNF